MTVHHKNAHIVIIGAGIGGLTTAALLAQAGQRVTVLEAATYPGGSAGTFYHQGYRYEAGATLAGGFQPGGPHHVIGQRLGIDWPVRPANPAWVVHLPDRQITISREADLAQDFPGSAAFWQSQRRAADIAWSLAADGLPWPPRSAPDFAQLAQIGLHHFPQDVRLMPLALSTACQWIARHGMAHDHAFMRFIDAQLLISAQTTSQHANALYSATALDLARQGVMHVEGGIGGLAQTLANKVTELGGDVRYKHEVTRIRTEAGRAARIFTQRGRQAGKTFDADFVIANLTPWSLDALLGDDSPRRLKREIARREAGWGAFVLYLGVDANQLPSDLPDHHQVITQMAGPLGEGHSIFLSISPAWDTSRAPEGQRAVTVTTHTAVGPWWDALNTDPEAYAARRAEYTERVLSGIETALPGFRASITRQMDGTPVTYANWVHRQQGMVGGFPATSLFRARGPLTGIPNLRLVGDSIFPGQSTAGVTVGAMRVATDVLRHLPQHEPHSLFQPQATG